MTSHQVNVFFFQALCDQKRSQLSQCSHDYVIVHTWACSLVLWYHKSPRTDDPASFPAVGAICRLRSQNRNCSTLAAVRILLSTYRCNLPNTTRSFLLSFGQYMWSKRYDMLSKILLPELRGRIAWFAYFVKHAVYHYAYTLVAGIPYKR